MLKGIAAWLQRHHFIHTWGEVEIFDADHFTFSGLSWGWRHRFQPCVHPKCRMRRLIEGYRPQSGYYLRPGFHEEL